LARIIVPLVFGMTADTTACNISPGVEGDFDVVARFHRGIIYT
jgi:hypothetical protein